jgi:ribosome-associated heat shock protein Hsp15
VESVRLDRWLCAARIFKSRTLATDACGGGHVLLNDAPARPGKGVHVGDRIECRKGERLFVLEVLRLAERRLSAPLARELYADHSPPPPPREPRFAPRERGAGRPTKRDRRALERLRGGSE